MPRSFVKYSPLADADDATSNALQGSTVAPDRFPYFTKLRRIWPWLAHLFLTTAALLILLLAWSTHPTDQQCTRRLSSYSPALEAVEHIQVVLNGTLTFPSIYRGEPSASVDAAWDEITKNVKFSVIAEDDLTKIGQTVRPSTVRIDEKFGGGILAGFELGHQMHCLNMLRKHTYIDYYGPLNQDYLNDRTFYRIHLDHCIEMLRQSIMCTGDVGLITFDWVEGHKQPYPNFNTRHICRDSSKLYQWIEQAPHVPAAHVYRTVGTIDLPDSP